MESGNESVRAPQQRQRNEAVIILLEETQKLRIGMTWGGSGLDVRFVKAGDR
jgi:hypothetical protein